jgi:hypothetical protein
MMNRSTYCRAVLLCIVAALLFGSSLISRAQTAALAASGQHSAYLPLIIKQGNAAPPTTPPPTPTPAPVPAGFFTLTNWLAYSAATAVDTKGGVHLALFISDEGHDDQPLNQPALYSYCPGPVSTCADSAKWSDPVQFGERVNEVQVAVTRDGLPRLLVRRSGSRFNEYDYYACDSNCAQASQWSGLYIAEDAGGDLNGFSLGNHYFALDAQDRPRFAYGNAWGNGQPNGIYYTWCDEADCTQPGSWQRIRALIGPDNVTTSGEAASLAFDGDKPRMVISRYVSGLPAGLLYLACDADCDQTESWSATEIAPPGDKAWASWDLALDGTGHPRLALYEPPALDISAGLRPPISFPGALLRYWTRIAERAAPLLKARGTVVCPLFASDAHAALELLDSGAITCRALSPNGWKSHHSTINSTKQYDLCGRLIWALDQVVYQGRPFIETAEDLRAVLQSGLEHRAFVPADDELAAIGG